ncbi:MAG: DPP IV N-terminal domain-containing protein [Edaphobacter sp.]
MSLAHAQTNNAVTIDEALEASQIGGLAVSPDGQHVVYDVTRTNWKTNAFERDLWIADRAGKSILLTTQTKSSSGAKWSPDGKWIAFLSDRPGQIAETKADTTQLYVIDPMGGDARQVTKLEDGVNGFEWAPDSKHIAFMTKDEESKAEKDRKEKYGDYTVVYSDERMTHLWTIDVASLPAGNKAPEATRITEGAFNVQGFSWSPDGTRIAFAASKDPELRDNGSTTIYVVSVADKKVTKLVTTPGPNTNPQFSPDGTQVAFVTADGAKNFFYSNQKIAVVAATGGTPKVVSGDFDEDARLIQWSDGGIYFSASKKTAATFVQTGCGERRSDAGDASG